MSADSIGEDKDGGDAKQNPSYNLKHMIIIKIVKSKLEWKVRQDKITKKN